MKLKNILLPICVALTSLPMSCAVCGIDYDYTDEPIYISFNEIENDIKFTEPRKINTTGKIYLYKNYIFIGEQNFGVHIIDNTNPNSPQKYGFIKIPFNEDIAIKNDTLYANTLGGLISVDISNINNPQIIQKLKVDEFIYPSNFNIISGNKIQIGYKRTGPNYKNNCPPIFLPMPTTTVVNPPQPQNDIIGQAGSTSRFAIVNDYIYTVSQKNLHLFDISDSKKMKDSGKVNIDSYQTELETIFPYKDKLFLGSTRGTYIYDNNNPQQPTLITQVEHTRSCDPVVVENETAYVTLRSGTSCRNGNNQLDIIDLSDIKNSKVIKSYPMTNPSGLAIKSGNLFVCDGTDGLKIFNAKDPLNIKQLSKININQPKDIILNENYQGVVVSEDGLHQYNFSGLPEKTDFKELSNIKAEKDKYFSFNNEKDRYVKEGNTYYYKWYKEFVENKK